MELKHVCNEEREAYESNRRDDDAYNNFRAHIKAHYGKINAPI